MILKISFSKAQLYFRNNTEEPVYVTVCTWYSGGDSKYWGTEGWFKADPGERVQVSSAIGFNDNIYYYASSDISGKKYTGDYSFLVDPINDFFIKNADKAYQKKQNPNYEWRKFRHVDMNTALLQTKYTIELNY
jgi:uncharacterized membrane protein